MIIFHELHTDSSVFCAASDCIASYQRYYGENFEQSIPENAALLEFSPLGAPAEATPVVLWNQTDTEAGNAGRGRLEQGGKVWVAERVSQVDQGNYTVRSVNGNVLSYSRLTVHGETEDDAELTGRSHSHLMLMFISLFPSDTLLLCSWSCNQPILSTSLVLASSPLACPFRFLTATLLSFLLNTLRKPPLTSTTPGLIMVLCSWSTGAR